MCTYVNAPRHSFHVLHYVHAPRRVPHLINHVNQRGWRRPCATPFTSSNVDVCAYVCMYTRHSRHWMLMTSTTSPVYSHGMTWMCVCVRMYVCHAYACPTYESCHVNAPRHLYEMPHENESCHSCEWVMSLMWMSRVNELWHWFVSQIWMSHVTYPNESCCTYECAHVNTSCH